MIETTWKGAALARSNQVVRGGGLISHVPFFAECAGAGESEAVAADGAGAEECVRAVG